jgi:cytochrome P450
VIDTLAAINGEVVLAVGDLDLSAYRPLSVNIRVTPWIPLSALLPSCAAITHQGGAGSTFTAFACGVPQLVLPHFVDHSINASAVMRRGTGVAVPAHRANVESVRAAVDQVLADRTLRTAATEVREDNGRTLLAWLRTMRDEYPVWRDRTGVWHVFRYADVTRVISNPQVFSSDVGRVLPFGQKFSEGNLAQTDPPCHHQLRRLVGAAFGRQAVTELTPRIAEVTHELLDSIGGATEFDLVPALAYPLPMTVLSELLGLPISDWELFRSWADKVFDLTEFDSTDDPQFAQTIGATADMHAYLHKHCRDRRVHPRQDLVSQLVTIEVDGERLADEEVVNFSLTLVFAGHFTTTALLGNTVLCLDEHPETWAELRADRSLVDAALEEVLRYRCPFPKVGRVTVAEAELGGQVIPADVLVTPWLLSANRDERKFPHPDRFDIHRSPNHHVAFGHGIHFCLGELLARVEARIAVGVLLDRYTEIGLTPGVPLEFYDRGMFTARNVPVTVRYA